MSRLVRLIALLVLLSLLSLPRHTPTVQAQAVNSILIKESIIIRAHRLLRYWKAPTQENYWSWMPHMYFTVRGLVPAGSRLVVEFTAPDGKPWYSAECETPVLGPQEWGTIETPPITTHDDKRASVAIGTVGFTIKLKNTAQQLDQTLYTGRFKVNKFHKGNNLPAFQNQFEYYVDHDWTLPIGYLWLDTARDGNAPSLRTSLWFRGAQDATKLKADLYCNGKLVASSSDFNSAGASDILIMTSGNDPSPRWERWQFNFPKARGWVKDSSQFGMDGAHILYTNPGLYEIKVTRAGELIRTAQFKVGKNGLIEDSGLAAQNDLSSPVTILPVKVQEKETWDQAAWKTEAFYGNPLRGFIAP